MIAIVVSRADRASTHIGEQLLAAAEWDERVDEERPDEAGGGTYYRRPGFELREFADLHIELSDPTPAFGGPDEEPDLLAFVSRHSGETGALLTAHFTGNFGPAEYGGRDGELARAAPAAQKRLVESFERHAPEGYEVGIEGTHHGPSETAVPSLFVELGSGDAQWDDPDGARAVAEAVLDLAGTGPDLIGADGRPRHVVGFGGGHYAPRFTRIVAETAWAVGHVGVDWQLAELGAPAANAATIERAFERSRADLAVVDGDRPDLVATVEDLGHRVVSETWVREVGDRPLALVAALEAAVGPVDDGLRFGERSVPVDRGDDADAIRERVAVRPLPAALLERAQGVDADAARAAVEAHTLAFDTEQAGTRAAGDAAFAEPADREALVAALADVLRDAYAAVSVEADAVVAREEAFDPSLAAKLGVPEGPKFGRLASGEAVSVDGREIPPEAVRREREVRFER